MTPTTSASAERLNRGEWLVLAAVSALNLVPIWAFPYFAGQDTPNHLYAVEVLRALVGQGGDAPAFAAAFAPALALKSNILFHALMLGLCRVGLSLPLAHRVLLTAYALAFPLAGLACLRAAAPRATPLALLLLPLVWSWFVLQGLYNYAFSLVPALIWLGIVARDAGRPGLRASLALAVASVAVYLAHAGTFVALLLVSALRVLWPGDGTRVALRARAIAALPLAGALAPATLLAVLGMGGALYGSAHPEATLASWQDYGALEAAGTFFLEFAMRYHVWELAILGPPLVAAIAIPLAGACRRTQRPDPAVAPRWPLRAAFVLLVLYFALPHIVSGSDASPRLRPLVVFCLLCYAGTALSARARRRVAALALATGVAGALSLCWDFARMNRQLEDFTAGIPLVTPGSRLYPMVFDPRRPGSQLVKPYLHAWGYYGIERHVVTPFAFAWHETRFPYRYRELPVHALDSAFPSDAEDAPYALEQGRLCASVRRFAPSQSCDAVRAAAESRLAELGTAYDYVLTWAAPDDFRRTLAGRGYRTVLERGLMGLYEPPGARH
jgi:hypothetical protein